MRPDIYKKLYQALLNNSNIKEFAFIRKIRKKIKGYQLVLSTSYAMLVSSLFFSGTEAGFYIIVSALVLIFYSQSKIKSNVEIINDKMNVFESTMSNYINSEYTYSFRKDLLSKLETEEISKKEYVDIVKEEVKLTFSLIKNECFEEDNVDIIKYKASIENIFNNLKYASDNNLLDVSEVVAIQRKWTSDLKALCNQYNATDLETEIKYLYTKLNLEF
jgi:hypothetical protein